MEQEVNQAFRDKLKQSSLVYKDRFIKSFGALDEIFAFLEQKDVLKLQQLNIWMYITGVQRVQARLELAVPEFFFAFPNNNMFENMIVICRRGSTEPCRRLHHKDI